MIKGMSLGLKKVLASALILLFIAAFARVFLRIETTLLAYELGRLKTKEAQLLEEHSHLRMQLAKLTSRNHLSLMATALESNDGPDALAAK